MRTKKIKGKHFVLDFYGCDYHEINSSKYLEEVLIAAAKAAKMEILHTHFHPFSPHGVTGVLLLSTSHISVHTWPEYGHAAFDVFSCSDEAQTRLAVDYIINAIQHKTKRIQSVDRGYAALMTIDIPVYKTGTKKTLKVHRKLAEIKSQYQKIQVLDLEKFGKTLLIDGIPQVSDSDHKIYDKAILKPLRKTDKHILVLGGGDGFLAQEIVQKQPRTHVTLVELDSEVLYCAKTYFDQASTFSHPRVKVIVGDALQYLKSIENTNTYYDGVVIDLTDVPVGTTKAKTKLERFYDKLLRRSASFLKKDGWISAQASVTKIRGRKQTLHAILKPLFERHLVRVKSESVMIPSYLEENTFLYGSNPKR